jgi:hypothetical protein
MRRRPTMAIVNFLSGSAREFVNGLYLIITKCSTNYPVQSSALSSVSALPFQFASLIPCLPLIPTFLPLCPHHMPIVGPIYIYRCLPFDRHGGQTTFTHSLFPSSPLSECSQRSKSVGFRSWFWCRATTRAEERAHLGRVVGLPVDLVQQRCAAVGHEVAVIYTRLRFRLEAIERC